MVTKLRRETEHDGEGITRVHREAFAHHPHSRNTEHAIVRALRRAGALTLSLVAEEGGELVGHIAFSPVAMEDGSPDWYGVGPLGVRPALQRRGIGKALLREGVAQMKSRGARGVVLVGDPAYYRPLGFRDAPTLAVDGVPPENLLVLIFDGEIPQGRVGFHPGFFASGEDAQDAPTPEDV